MQLLQGFLIDLFRRRRGRGKVHRVRHSTIAGVIADGHDNDFIGGLRLWQRR